MWRMGNGSRQVFGLRSAGCDCNTTVNLRQSNNACPRAAFAVIRSRVSMTKVRLTRSAKYWDVCSNQIGGHFPLAKAGAVSKCGFCLPDIRCSSSPPGFPSNLKISKTTSTSELPGNNRFRRTISEMRTAQDQISDGYEYCACPNKISGAR